MDEASKTRRFRGPEFVDKYLSGKVLDIGCGPDLVVPGAQPFDLPHGDANCIATYLPGESFDCVHSSHCLEHMRDVPEAIRQWWSLVKPGGVMITTVPEENLYEQGIWPSVFNPDHKATFRLDKSASWSPISYDLRELVAALPSSEILEAAIQDAGYNHRLKRHGISPVGGFVRRARISVLRRVGVDSRPINAFSEQVEFYFGYPLDQTRRDALAQIQVVARKRLPN
jgi:hypothetical protein